MFRFVVAMALAFLLVAGAAAMPVAVENEYGKTEIMAGTSLVFGLEGDYNTLGAGKSNWSLMAGYCQSLTPNDPGGRFYGIFFGEAGRFQGSDEYKLEARVIWYLNEYRRGFNFGLLFGPGVTFEQFDGGPIDPSYTITHLLGTSGLVATYSFTTKMGAWAAAEFQVGEKYTAYRFGAGINISVF